MGHILHMRVVARALGSCCAAAEATELPCPLMPPLWLLLLPLLLLLLLLYGVLQLAYFGCWAPKHVDANLLRCTATLLWRVLHCNGVHSAHLAWRTGSAGRPTARRLV